MQRYFQKSRLLTTVTAGVATALIRTVKATSRTIHEPPNLIDHLRAQVPFIMAMWHGQFMMLSELNTREYKVSAMVARHGDAEVMARVLRHFGISSIRGAGAGKRKKNRGGVYALRAAHHALENGTIVAMTADIPGFKQRTAGEGIVTLARLSGRPIIPVAAATSRYVVLNTWSRMTVNLPFSTLAVVAGDPIFVPADTSDAEIESARQDVERSLNAVTARAYDLAKSGKASTRQRESGSAAERYRQ
ncbi:lysophospholipid acyltransferase family protein [Hyphomicrobium sp.]|jgi:3-deoxy-D-manno-octulosonic-acid transferase|uniref:lysophospholipid acyltransferase family protein n=1 Tax=Hyphomicrobium sp. TaxID=82 RepID=UPI002BE91385|nr:lysophospholipid acyltransferase family protein [Hyphomicrobium sp.]HVZ05701.1 lysophospholipid acyltransferase family protein [Hyphomicrobium sp.]